ncbi:hypothetical protein L1987_24417 [Smallanthus sonchifolius]|uniref:Uncharacterized protein n=1 Tax=Smallanthus sonchifolius TaxID=185202 RepID=A0ACB9ILU3_9ASTR|nr:hypothetical protein L1987_24417 [Smallanthus sonchifolius]
MVALPLLVAVLVVGVTQSAATEVAVTCEPTQLLPCLKSIMQGTPPPPLCCTKLKAQKPCMCGYIKNPKFAKYVKSPNAKKVAKACHVTIPKSNKTFVLKTPRYNTIVNEEHAPYIEHNALAFHGLQRPVQHVFKEFREPRHGLIASTTNPILLITTIMFQ